jgi:hypothetical protein
LVVALLVAGSALAVWLLVRFPGFGPRTLRGATLHLAAATACGYVVSPAMQLVVMLPVPETRLLALLVGAFPPLVYLLLSIGWLFRAIQRLVGVYS